MADIKELDLDPGFTYLLTQMWKMGLTELNISEAEIEAAFDALEGQSMLIIPTDTGYRVKIDTRENAAMMAEGLDLETGAVERGVTIN